MPDTTPTGRTARPIDLLHDELMAQAAADHRKRAAQATPPADQAAARARIADALYAHDHPGALVPLGESGMESDYHGRAAAVWKALYPPVTAPTVHTFTYNTVPYEIREQGPGVHEVYEQGGVLALTNGRYATPHEAKADFAGEMADLRRTSGDHGFEWTGLDAADSPRNQAPATDEQRAGRRPAGPDWVFTHSGTRYEVFVNTADGPLKDTYGVRPLTPQIFHQAVVDGRPTAHEAKADALAAFVNA